MEDTKVGQLLESNEEILKMLLSKGSDFVQAIHGHQKQSESVIARRYFENQEELHLAALHPSTNPLTHPLFTDKLSQHTIRIVWERAVKRKQLIALFFWLFFIGIFMAFAFTQASLNDPRMWEQHNTVVDQFVGEFFNDQETKSFQDITDLSDLWDWVDNVWMTKVYSTELQGFWRDNANVLHPAPVGRVQQMYTFLGRPQIRQWRTQATSEACQQTTYGSKTCFNEWASSKYGITEQTDAAYSDQNPFGPGKVWQFNASDFVDDFYPSFLYVPDHNLPQNGYTIKMPLNVTEATATVAYLKDNTFFDMNSRVIMFEGVLASPSSYMATMLRLFVVQNGNGGLLAIPYVSTNRLNPFASADIYTRFVLEGVFGVLIILYALSEVGAFLEKWHDKIPRHELPNMGAIGKVAVDYFGADSMVGRCLLKKDQEAGQELTCFHDIVWPKYIYNLFNVFDTAILAIFVAIVYLHIAQFVEASKVDWSPSNEDIPDIFMLGYMQRCKMLLIGINLVFCWILTLEYIMIKEELAMMVKIIIGMMSKLRSFIVVLVVFVMAFASLNYVVFGIGEQSLSTLQNTMFLTFDGSLGNADFDSDNDQDKIFLTIYFVVFAMIMVVLLLNLLIAVMSEAYDEVKESASAYWAFQQLQNIVDQAEDELDIEVNADDLAQSTSANVRNTLSSLFAWPKLYRRYFMPILGNELKLDCTVMNGDPLRLMLAEDEDMIVDTVDTPQQHPVEGDQPVADINLEMPVTADADRR